MEDQPLRVLVVATDHGGCRAQMLKSWLNRFGGDRIYVEVGSIQPGKLDAFAVRAMYEIGLDISGQSPDPLFKWLDEPWDWAVLMRDPKQHRPPNLTATRRILYREFPNPAKGEGREDVVMGYYRSVRDDIHDWARSFVEQTIGLARKDQRSGPASGVGNQV